MTSIGDEASTIYPSLLICEMRGKIKSTRLLLEAHGVGRVAEACRRQQQIRDQAPVGVGSFKGPRTERVVLVAFLPWRASAFEGDDARRDQAIAATMASSVRRWIIIVVLWERSLRRSAAAVLSFVVSTYAIYRYDRCKSLLRPRAVLIATHQSQSLTKRPKHPSHAPSQFSRRCAPVLRFGCSEQGCLSLSALARPGKSSKALAGESWRGVPLREGESGVRVRRHRPPWSRAEGKRVLSGYEGRRMAYNEDTRHGSSCKHDHAGCRFSAPQEPRRGNPAGLRRQKQRAVRVFPSAYVERPLTLCLSSNVTVPSPEVAR